MKHTNAMCVFIKGLPSDNSQLSILVLTACLQFYTKSTQAVPVGRGKGRTAGNHIERPAYESGRSGPVTQANDAPIPWKTWYFGVGRAVLFV